MRISDLGRAAVWLLPISAAVGTVAWLVDGATALPLRNSPPPSSGEELREVATILLAAGAVLVAAAGPAPFRQRSARLGWALVAIGTAAMVAASEGPFVTGAYSLYWPLATFLGGLALAAIGVVLAAIAVLRSGGQARIAGLVIIGAVAVEISVGGLAGVAIAAMALGLAWLERLRSTTT